MKAEMRPLKTRVYDVTFRCPSCRTLVLYRATFDEPTAVVSEDDFQTKRKCPRCKGRLTYYWAASWASDPKDAA